MSLPRLRHTKLQWFAALLILSVAFLGPHLHMPPKTAYHTLNGVTVHQNSTISSLFTSSLAANELSYRTRDTLLDRYGDLYKRSPYFNIRMEEATAPMFDNFNDFLLSPYELLIRFPRGTVAPGIEGQISISLPVNEFLPYMREDIVAAYLPGHQLAFRESREQLARQHRTQQLVNENRSNINCKTMKCIALTFDDGPDGEKGRRIVQTLKERHAVGTFFVLGSKILTSPQEVKEAFANKNEIGSHTWNHPHLTALSAAAIKQQIAATDQIIEKTIGRKPTFVRPPYADYNASVLKIINRPTALWNIDTRDWANRNADVVTSRALTRAHPGAVILFHSIYSSTATAIPRVVDELQARGYVLVTMSELYGITPQNQTQFDGVKFFGR